MRGGQGLPLGQLDVDWQGEIMSKYSLQGKAPLPNTESATVENTSEL